MILSNVKKHSGLESKRESKEIVMSKEGGYEKCLFRKEDPVRSQVDIGHESGGRKRLRESRSVACAVIRNRI